MNGEINGGRALVERMVNEAEGKIRDAEEVIGIMKLAGEDVSDEENLLAELKEKVARYRAALTGSV
ncbi:MAG: hypothetical protein PHQ43_15000 [Dehalococcoidales bacterium]|nr:hypothetical protein [Dehalococcoidales bacterium]